MKERDWKLDPYFLRSGVSGIGRLALRRKRKMRKVRRIMNDHCLEMAAPKTQDAKMEQAEIAVQKTQDAKTVQPEAPSTEEDTAPWSDAASDDAE